MSSTLDPGNALLPGQSIFSPNRQYELTYQTDGNLVIYKYGGGGRQPIWSTMSNGTNPIRAIMQTDGNFVVYANFGEAIQSTKTNGQPGAYLTLQDDGNLVLYRGSPQSKNALWCSQTMGSFANVRQMAGPDGVERLYSAYLAHRGVPRW